MRNLWTYILLLVLCNFKLVRSFFNVQTVGTAKSKLSLMFPNDALAYGMPECLAMLEDTIDILSCLPIIKDGRCLKSNTCTSPKLKIDGIMIPFILKLCEDPYQIVINFLPFEVPGVRLDLNPIIITLHKLESQGAITITSSTTISKRARFFRIKNYKVSFYVAGMVRYDCTKPKNDWGLRVAWNLKAPNGQWTSIFYNLKIRIEVKRLKWKWKLFRFHWECTNCKDLVNESGSFGGGHPSCEADMRQYREGHHQPGPFFMLT